MEATAVVKFFPHVGSILTVGWPRTGSAAGAGSAAAPGGRGAPGRPGGGRSRKGGSSPGGSSPSWGKTRPRSS